MTEGMLFEVVKDVEHVMLDFDGPICSVFAGRPAPEVAERLRVLTSKHMDLPESLAETRDPLDFLRATNGLATDFFVQLRAEVEREEVTAVETAEPTRGAKQVIEASKHTGRRISVVSNNARAAVDRYLQRHSLADQIDYVAARTSPDPSLMKPNTYLLEQALGAWAKVDNYATARQRAQVCVLVGDSVTDIEAARAAGVRSIGFADKPGKFERLADAGATVVTTSMVELAAALLRLPEGSMPSDRVDPALGRDVEDTRDGQE